ncbi:hypothetical protein [Tateyamaria sp. SN3-11]|uniref:hypothetical protein n=1 Tax=Tateyamaria sp. SN3-11 TaxID=3092147 RepID=UPI0039ED4E68
MSEEEFRRALFDVSFDVDELVELFHSTMDEMLWHMKGGDNEQWTSALGCYFSR